MTRSMTGFARAEENFQWGIVVCEIRSVNHRYLEATYKLPDVFKSTEADLRDAIKAFLSRGKVEVLFHLQSTNNTQGLELNEPLVTQLSMLAEKISVKLTNPSKIDPLTLMQWPEVLQTSDTNHDDIAPATLSLFKQALTKLVNHRTREGAELAQFVFERINDITKNVCKIRELFPTIIEGYRLKLHTKLTELKVEANDERFHQEVVYAAQKYDIAEELDRLDAHCNEIKYVLQQGGAIGRRLDFLMQELNREANTLASKSLCADTTKISVELKVLIEQMREQIQNIE